MSTELPELLCRVNFPLYQATMITPRHLLVAGGGGAANTGVFNGIEIFEISHNGENCTTESVKRFSTREFAVMNCASGSHDTKSQKTIIAVGHNENCQLYSCQLARELLGSTEDTEVAGNNGVTNRNSTNAKKTGQLESRLTFHIEPLNSVQTDFNTPEPYQKVVRISYDSKLLVTGGDDGILRVWTFPDLNAIHEIEAHDKEIDDIEFSPDNTKVVSISKDGRALVWDVKKGKKHAEMGWDPPNKIKYLYKRIRFGRVEGDSRKYKVFTIVNPVGASKPPSYLHRWNSKSFTIEQGVDVVGSLSALAVSDNGNFVATGSMFDGTVEIYTAFNLAKIKRVEKSHGTFITGLEFLPTTPETDAIRGFSDASVVSISVDHQVCIHHIPRLSTISFTTASVMIFLFLILVFCLCSYLGL